MSKIVFFGTPDYVICVPEELKNAGHKIVAVVTQPPKPVGRKKILTISPVEKWARQNHVQVLHNTTLLHKRSLTVYSGVARAEIGVLASYGKIVEKEVLENFPKGIINIHPSLLPKWRGAAPVQEQILAGEKEIGISLMLMDEQMDTGPILEQTKIPANPDDTQQSLLVKTFKKGSEMLVKILPLYTRAGIVAKEQDHSKATYTYKTSESKEKAYFDIDTPPAAEKLDRMIRAYYPWPIAWTKWGGKIVKLYPERKIHMEGKKIVNFETFRRSQPDFPLTFSL